MNNTNTTSIILDGRLVAEEILKNVKNEISILKENSKRTPGLAVVLVGDDPASQTYVNSKEKKSNELGINSVIHRISGNVSEEDLLKLVSSLNKDPNIDGILIQLPLPKHINSEKVIKNISPSKDVDGLHPHNLGKLLIGEKCLKPCTPNGVIEILNYYKINVEGKNIVVIGRSILVGKPVALLLLNKNATITIAHSKTKDLEELCSKADILITAIGKPKTVKENWVKSGAVIVDVGINKILVDGKNKLVGDVDFDDVKDKCQAITPVPGGVGPVTIAMLMSNTLEAYKMRSGES